MKFLIICIHLFLSVLTGFSQPVPWKYIPTSVSHTVNIGSAHITIDDILVETGDVIGLFYDSSGYLACGGYAAWPATEIIAYGDDSGTPDGFATGEAFKFKIWKKKSNCIIDSGTIVQFQYLPPAFNDSIYFKANGTSKMITLNGSMKDIYYSKTSFCEGDPNPLPIKTGTIPDVTYSSQTGLAINPATGQIDISTSTQGTYTVFFHTSLCLKRQSFSLTIKLNIDNLAITVNHPTCVDKGALMINESTIVCGTSPFSYRLKNIQNAQQITSSSSQITEIPEGNYELYVKDASGTEVKFKDFILFSKDCKDLIIAPYSTGSSSYFIPYEGKAKIYDRFGMLRKEINIPADWDATDNSGNIVPSGEYVIICNEDKQIVINVIK